MSAPLSRLTSTTAPASTWKSTLLKVTRTGAFPVVPEVATGVDGGGDTDGALWLLESRPHEATITKTHAAKPMGRDRIFEKAATWMPRLRVGSSGNGAALVWLGPGSAGPQSVNGFRPALRSIP